MTEFYVRLHLWLARWRWGVLGAVLGCVLAAVWLTQRLRLNEDFTDMLPMSAPGIAEQVAALRHVRQADRLYVDVATRETDPELLAQAADLMHAALLRLPALTDLRYTFDPAELQAAYREWQTQLPSLLGSNELQALEARFTQTALEQRLAWLKQAMSQPQGLMLKEVAQSDPVGLSDSVATRWRALQAGVGDAQIVAGRITSADGRHVLISAAPGFRPGEMARGTALIDGVLRAAREVEGRFSPGAVRIAVTGAHRVALDNATLLRGDSTLTSVIAMVAVALLLLGSYRRRWLGLLGLAPTVVGALAAMVVLHLTGDAVSAVALGCGSILVGVTVDYGIYVFYHLEDSPPADRMALARTVAGLLPTLSFGALTTMAAFLVMLVSPVSGHRQLGLFGASAVAFAALFAGFVLPLFVPVGKPQAAGLSPLRLLPLTRLIERLFAWRARHARAVGPVVLVFSLLCAVGIARLRFDGDFARLNGVTPATARDEAAIRETWGKALALTSIVVVGTDREEALQRNERVHAVLERLRQSGVVESFSSVAPVLPSARTREEHRRAWQSFWSEARLEQLRQSLGAAAAKLGFRAEAFRPYLDRLQAPPPEAATGTAPAAASQRLLADYLTEKPGEVSVISLAKVRDTAGFRVLRDEVLRAAPGALLLNKAAMSEEISRIARRGLPIFAVLVGALNALMLYLLLGRLELVAVTLLPIVAGVVWTLGCLGLAGLPIDMSNFIFVIFVVGVGGDYSLFLISAELEPWRGLEGRTASTGAAVTLCALTTLFGVGVLVLARHPALFGVGLTALLGISLSLVATLFLVPAGLAWLRRRREASPPAPGADPASLRRAVLHRYRFQGPYVEQYAFWKTRMDPLFAAVDRVAPRQGSILDLGCGYGLVAHWLTLAEPGRSVLGVDHDADKLRVAKAVADAAARTRFEHRDLLQWTDYPACDAVLLCDVLHYFPVEQKRAILQRAFQALRSGGCLVLRDAACQRSRGHGHVVLFERLAVFFGINRTVQGLHFATREEYLAMLAAAGFTRVEDVARSGLGSNLMLIARKD